MVEVGKEYVTNKGDRFLVIEIYKNYRSRIRFLDEFKYEKEVHTPSILKGDIRNPYSKTTQGVGYLGVGKYNSKTMGGGIYSVWSGVIYRCYSEKWKLKCPSYKNVTVCREWHNFQVFAEWYEENYPLHIDNIKFELDKDLKQYGLEHKVYSPETCVIIPKRINGFMVNIQSDNKSGYIGVYKLKGKKGWRASITDQQTKESKGLGIFHNIEEASECYNKHRKIIAEELKEWVRGLNYLDESVIQLIR